ncbi:MAG TPA: urease accessory protein UreE [Chthoniobacterales bacterium]|nr:urease accessory protein UreE [Chthoniobacterales bacterium]
MLRIDRYADRQPGKAEAERLPKLVLAYELRQKSRLRATLSDGTDAALFLPRGTILRDGDILQADNGMLIRVESSPQKVLLVTAEQTEELIKAAYHLGNRHAPVEFGKEHLKLEFDPVLKEMLLQLGVQVTEEFAPFHPERGAYGGGHRHGHDETFAEDHALAAQRSIAATTDDQKETANERE